MPNGTIGGTRKGGEGGFHHVGQSEIAANNINLGRNFGLLDELIDFSTPVDFSIRSRLPGVAR